MARGGYRPGAGRPRGTTKVKARSSSELTPEMKVMIRQLLAMGERLVDGGTLTNTEMKLLDKIGVELSNELSNDLRMLEGFKW